VLKDGQELNKLKIREICVQGKRNSTCEVSKEGQRYPLENMIKVWHNLKKV
jgi:hypothetical protein